MVLTESFKLDIVEIDLTVQGLGDFKSYKLKGVLKQDFNLSFLEMRFASN